MTVFARKTTSSNSMFHNRVNRIYSVEQGRYVEIVSTPIPDLVVLCNGCNHNITEGYLVYLDKTSVHKNHPYDIYCKTCLDSYFPKAKMLE